MSGTANNTCVGPKLDSTGNETALSLALDAGSNALLPAGVATDIAGNPRIRASRSSCGTPVPAIVDMGAFEFTGTQPPLPCPAQIPAVVIGRGPLVDRGGSTVVSPGCSASAAFYCDGTIELDTVKRFAAASKQTKRKPRPRILVLGNSHFLPHQGRAHRARVGQAVEQRTAEGEDGPSLGVTVRFSAQNASRVKVSGSATRTLALLARRSANTSAATPIDAPLAV